eukprot:361355_1
MRFSSNKIEDAKQIMNKFPQIFDNINIRLCLLKNKQLITPTHNDNNLNNMDDILRNNLKNVFQIVLKGANIDKSIESELISFITQLFQSRFSFRNVTCAIFGKLCFGAKRSNVTLPQIFKSALRKAISQKFTIPDRISMFLECKAFYNQVAIHSYFVDVVMDGGDRKINLWSDKQIKIITDLALIFAKNDDDHIDAIKLWNQIFEKLIEIPENVVSDDTKDNQNEEKDDKDEAEKDEKDEKDENDEEAKDDEKFSEQQQEQNELIQNELIQNEIVDDNLMTNLEYCLSMRKWLEFAMKCRHIKVFDLLVNFATKILGNVNELIKSKEINIQCLQLLQAKRLHFHEVVKNCQYYNEFDFKTFEMLIKQVAKFDLLSKRFIVFLNKFTRKDFDAIGNDTKLFVEYLKNCDMYKYIDVENKEEWKNWLVPNQDKLSFIQFVKKSDVFFNIWCRRREMNLKWKWTLEDYFDYLYVESKKEWDELVGKCKNSNLTFDDRKYFQKLDILNEFTIMALEQDTIIKIKIDMNDSLKLDEYCQFVQNLINVVDVFVEKGNTQIVKINDEDRNWFALTENLKTANIARDDQTQSISDAADLYRKIKSSINEEYKPLTKQWISALVKCANCVDKLANGEEFEINRFNQTLELLDDSNDGQCMQLSGSLRSVRNHFANIWTKTFHSKLSLLQHFAKIKLKQNDINNILEVDDALPKINQIVLDVGKMVENREIEKLDSAMSSGCFRFSDEKDIEKCIDEQIQTDITVIASSCLKLESFTYDEIQKMVDIILLCRRNEDTHNNKKNKQDEIKQDEVKHDGKNENPKQSVKEYITKIEICKEISELRVRYMIEGGKMSYNNEMLSANVRLEIFNEKQEEWRKRLTDWSEFVLKLRDAHLFNYFTLNKTRMIIDKLNQYKKNTDKMIFEQLLSDFRYVKPELTRDDFENVLEKWKIVDEGSKNSLTAYEDCFNNQIILSIYQKQDIKNKNYNIITVGRPNLIITKSEKDALFTLLKLYYNIHTTTIHSNQVLICNKSTTLEQIQILIFRCLQNEERFKYTDTSAAPLFCLLFPEYLNHSILDGTIDLFNKYLLSKNQKTNRYSFVVLSCAEHSRLCYILGQYKVCDKSTHLTADDATDICHTLFNGMNDIDILKENKLFVQQYLSKNVGAGKSFVIEQNANAINHENPTLIKIPINSSNIDLDFIVDRLYQCYDGVNRKKTIYQIDISSSASSTVNILIFNLLYLKHISTPRHQSFSITNDMAFLIELPTNLASIKTKNHKICDEFYLLHSPIQIPTKTVDHKSNPFQYNDRCHYAAKWLQYFNKGDLKKKDPDPADQKVKENELCALIKRFSRDIYSSPIHEKSIWEYLFTQFEQVVHSVFLRNEHYKDEIGTVFKQWKHLVTKSIIELAEDFSKRLYDIGDSKDNENEAKGTESFHLTKKWREQKEAIVLLNQSADGTISFLVSDIKSMDQKLKKALNTFGFDLLGWAQQNEKESKEKKLELLLKILGTNKKDLKQKLLKEKPYCDYALTFDNILKMVAIFFRIKASIPVILMGETGCGKTCLLNYLACAANKETETADVHGGFTYVHIKEKMHIWINKANAKLQQSEQELQNKLLERCGEMKQDEYKETLTKEITKQHEMQKTSDLWIFLDEINTSPDIGFFKEILC